MTPQTPLSPVKERNSAIELLRLIAMLFVVISHSTVHGEFPTEPSLIPLHNTMLDWMTLGNLGVDIFVLLSGFLLCEKPFHSNRANSLLKFLMQVWTYSLFCYLLALLCGHNFRAQDLLTVFLPTLSREYWFFTAYVFLLLMSPFLNLLLSHLSPTLHRLLIGAGILVICLLPPMLPIHIPGLYFLEFILLYLMGAALKLHSHRYLCRFPVQFGLTILSFALLFGLSALPLLPHDVRISLFDRRSLLVLGAACGLVSMAVYATPRFWPRINRLSACTFGIYLFHDNRFFRPFLWQGLFDHRPFYNSPSLLPRMALSILLIYAAGLALEYLRQRFLEPKLLPPMLDTWNRLYHRLNAMFSRQKTEKP